jgi:hypothetical protein
MLRHPLIPAIALAFSIFRVVSGNVTWVTVLSIVLALVWLVTSIQNWRAQRQAAEASSRVATGEGFADVTARTPGRTEELRGALDTIKRMRSEQFSEPPLPTEEEVRATARPAIYLHRAALPVPLDHPGRSYLGGLPRMPPGLAWPEIEKYERFPLTFLAQIDLAELPVIESSPLPRSGTLYFFGDMNADSPETTDCRVLYYAGDTTRLPIRELPSNARPYGFGGEPWPWLPEESVWAKTNFRFPLEFTVFDSVRDYFVKELSGMPPRRNDKAFRKLMAEEFTRRFGEREVPPTDQYRVLDADRDEWPFAWAGIEYGARCMARAVGKLASRREAGDVAGEFQRIGAAAAKWVERAARETPQARCDDAARTTFLQEWRALTAELDAISKRRKVYRSDPREDLWRVVMAACYTCASHGATAVIPGMYRQALEEWNDPSVTFPKHQMLGHGDKVQWAPVEYAQHTLLLQLIGDLGIGWHSNDGCTLQFWIEPEALRQATFESVEMTLECD